MHDISPEFRWAFSILRFCTSRSTFECQAPLNPKARNSRVEPFIYASMVSVGFLISYRSFQASVVVSTSAQERLDKCKKCSAVLCRWTVQTAQARRKETRVERK